jgi:hypothetical protein
VWPPPSRARTTSALQVAIRKLVTIGPWTSGLFCAVLACGCWHSTHSVAGTSPPVSVPAPSCRECNVLLISIDTLRADHLSAYGYRRQTSPNLDRFAAESVLFEQNINTGGGTLPVHASMFTSLPPTVHGVWVDSHRRLGKEVTTLAEQMRAAGYQTRGYTGGGWVRAIYGLAKGFDFFYDNGGDFKVELPMLYSWLSSHRGGKFFVFLHTYDVHSGFGKLPYDHPGFNQRFTAGYDGTFDGCKNGRCASTLLTYLNDEVRLKKARGRDLVNPQDVEYIEGLYDGGIAYADAELGRLFERLRSLGLWQTTLIVLTADHGEEFLEHRLFLHHQNYEEVAHIPLIIHFPNDAYGGRRIPELVSTLEVMPTILDAVGAPANPEMQGHSVLPLISGGRAGRPEVYIAGSIEKLRTLSWSLMVGPNGPAELFDLVHDRRETSNVIQLHPEVAAALYLRYQINRQHDLLSRRAAPPTGPEALVKVSGAERARLTALGYAE